MELDDRRVPVSELDDEQLQAELDRHGVVLTPHEARRIVELIGHDPTLCELHIFNVEWSEHCSYKSSKSTLQEFLPTEGPNVMLGPQEDAGIVFFTEHKGKRYGVVIAHESHNHPSQVLPNEGAATGIGGIVRDVDCMGARVFGTADPLRFGDPEGQHADRTRWIVSGVVDGIWQYGNALGVPNLAGDVYFAKEFDDNCLVNVVAVGIVAEEDIIHSAVPPQAADEPYVMILVGKPTDDSGFGGSAFASKILDEQEQEEDRGAVQVPDPFLKNVLLMRKANEAVRERAKQLGLAIGIKDIGGGGLACGSSEITAAGGFGVDIDLAKVHVGLENLLPETITCAETQERYVLAVPEHFADEVLRVYNEDWDLPNVYEGACARVIGRFTTDKQYTLTHGGKIVCEAPVEAVTSGISYQREERPRQYQGQEPEFEQPENMNEALLAVLGHRNCCSREYIYRAYDMEVQGNAVLRPGEAGAGVSRPLEGSDAAVALAVDGNPFYGLIDPYWGGATAVAEAMRNVAAVGAVPSAITDCLNFGNPEKPEQFWEFREGVRGLSDAAKNLWLKGYENAPVPVISGNVSFYNESATGSSVAPSPIIACVGVMPDYSKAVTVQLKQAGDPVYMVGARRDELGGSAYYQALGLGLGRNVPTVEWQQERAAIYGIVDAIDQGLVAACTDISDGGLAVALAEMAMGPFGRGEVGAEIELTPALNGLRPDKALFSESGGFVVEVRKGSEERFEEIMRGYGVEPICLGETDDDSELEIEVGGEDVIELSIKTMAEAWLNGLAKVLR
jgi:phosphoribosylformylglycinamidine synthase II